MEKKRIEKTQLFMYQYLFGRKYTHDVKQNIPVYLFSLSENFCI